MLQSRDGSFRCTPYLRPVAAIVNLALT